MRLDGGICTDLLGPLINCSRQGHARELISAVLRGFPPRLIHPFRACVRRGCRSIVVYPSEMAARRHELSPDGGNRKGG
jgi:hypothetical protein